MGQEFSIEYQRLCLVLEKVASKKALDDSDLLWIGRLLDGIRADESIREPVFKTMRERRRTEAHRHFWITMDFLHTRRYHEPSDELARREVANKWRVKPGYVRDVVHAQRHGMANSMMKALIMGEKDGQYVKGREVMFAGVIDYHRQRLLTGVTKVEGVRRGPRRSRTRTSPKPIGRRGREQDHP